AAAPPSSTPSIPISPTAPTTLVAGLNQPWSIVVDDTNIYWSATTLDCAVDPARANSVMRLPKDGGASVALVTGQACVSNLVINSASVFWTSLQRYRWFIPHERARVNRKRFFGMMGRSGRTAGPSR